MKLKIVGSAVDPRFPQQQFAASYIFNGTVAIDAGTIGFISSVDEQRQIQHVFLSHAHLDHISSLPIFLDNVYSHGPGCVSIYGNVEALQTLRTDIFNERVWPDLIRLSPVESPFMTLLPIAAGETVEVDGLRVTAVALEHVVPVLGYVVEDDRASVAIFSDTTTSPMIWNTLNRWPRPLDVLFLECAFPNRMRWLADKARHLTPAQFGECYARLQPQPPVVAVHIKPAFREEIVAELAALNIPRLSVGDANVVYEY
jgi:ribonuclease BN (tRNA processing enzyme)